MTRQSICLNGEWDFMPLPDTQPIQQLPAQVQWEAQKIRVPSSWRWKLQPEAAYQPYDLFGYPSHWNEAPAGLLHRRFTVRRVKGWRVWLIFKAALQRSAYFVNGQKVAESSEGYLPIELDATDFVRDGDNELVAWCGPFERIPTSTGEKQLVPGGSWFAGLARGLWQDVFLEYRPEVWLEDIAVRTSTRQQKIEVEITVENRSTEPFQAQVRAQVLDGPTAVKVLPNFGLSLQPGDRRTVHLEEAWPEAVFWSPEAPHLYQLETSLQQEDQTVDKQQTRFGFREVWLDGPNLMLNGVRVNLRGDAWHYQGFLQQTKAYALNWYRMCQQTGINFIRLHAMPYPEFYLDAADETGMLIVDESAIYGSGKSNQADHPEFIRACHAHLHALVRRDRNHPSIVIWSMQNEMRWVDGRDGYMRVIPELTRTIKTLDPTRPVSYDGDNRLIAPEACEIISMHYNIDGTVASWDKDKPLIFGEHGSWHYIAPQVCSDFAGPSAYLSYEACMESIGLRERHFIEYARKEDVTGVTPFNTANYAMWAMPEQPVSLSWDDLSTPGPKPRTIPAYTLTIDNRLMAGAPLFLPNPSWHHLQEAFKPVTVIQNEYDDAFFGGTELVRSFSIYNDTQKPAQARLVYQLKTVDGDCLKEGEKAFTHQPGERREWQLTFQIPEFRERMTLTLHVELFHGDRLVHQLEQVYRVYPQALKTMVINTSKKAGYLGSKEAYAVISRWLPRLVRFEEPRAADLTPLDILIIGPDYSGHVGAIQPRLKEFVERGGFLLVLEQSQFSLGDTVLSGRGFSLAHINDAEHPVFAGLSDEDLRFWHPANINAPDTLGLVANAFHKPAEGDFIILLECGEGDFGWGGLLWTPLVEYSMGRGRAVFNQVVLIWNWERVPPACLLLRNLLSYACQFPPKAGRTGVLMAEEGSPAEAFLERIGVDFTRNVAPAPGELVIVDPGALDERMAAELHAFAGEGGEVLVLPAEPFHQVAITRLVGRQVRIDEQEVYQLRGVADELTRGISPHDLYHIERVTYTPENAHNRLAARYCIRFDATGPRKDNETLFESVHNPWVEFFVNGRDAEFQKIPVATMVQKAEFQPSVYGARQAVGRGAVIFSQVLLNPENEKVRRVYTRLLGNLSINIRTALFDHLKGDQDYGIEAFMALSYGPGQDYNAMLAYFTDPHYVLNNLGEGVYGWMKRQEKTAGAITIPGSAGKTTFLTVFIESETNRDPSQRATGELPDSSIVPDLFLQVNCPFQLYVNGICCADEVDTPKETVKIGDVLLNKGINRLAAVCKGGAEDIRVNAWLKDKHGGVVPGLKYRLTLD